MQGEGEIKAHAELTAKYGITWKSLKPGRIHSISLWQAVSIERAPDGMGGTRKYKPCC